MRHTRNETEVQTLTRLITALDHGHPVTITYLKEETREVFAVNTKGVTVRRTVRTGRLIETVRTIEVYDLVISQAGDILIKAMDRSTGESRSFRLDRIRAYTVHRTAYVVPREVAADERPVRASLATVTVLPVAVDGADPVLLLADLLTAA